MLLLYGIICFSIIINGYDSAPVHSIESSNSSPPLAAMKFMKRYGYLESGTLDSEALYKESAIKDAIKTLQKFGNIPITGDLDNATLQLMGSPRCGLPDVIRKKQREKRYIIGSAGWRKRVITYFVANWSPKLGEEPVIDEIERAFDTWSGYSRLIFKPTKNPNADIIIAFGQGSHGDEYPFDGPGNVLAHAFFPYEMGSYGGDIHFDDDENWTIRPRDQNNGETDFFTVAVHELGHSLGLSHSPIPSSIMFPYYKGYSSGFQLGYDDILAMYQLYISQPPTESESINLNEPEETTTMLSSTTVTEENGNSDEEIVIASTPKVSSTVTFLGDYETVEEHRGHESTSSITETGATLTGTTAITSTSAIISTSTLKGLSIPDICLGSYDAMSLFRSDIFIFKGQYVWRFATRGNIKDGYPMRLDILFLGFPSNITRIDAAYERRTDGNFVLFTGKSYWVYNGDRFVENSPQPISNYGIIADVEKIDAVQVWAKNGKVYLYSGEQFWRFNEELGAVDPGYPESMNRWRGIPCNIDAAMTWTDGSTYFFKGKEFWRFDNVLIKAEDQYPQDVTDYWFTCE